MVSTRLTILVPLLCVSLLAGSMMGCERGNGGAETDEEPWRFESEQAPYAIDLAGDWQQTPAEDLNRFADLAVHMHRRFFVIVIPQELPRFEGVESADASDLKRASLGLLEERIDSFDVEREGPVEIDDKPGLSVFARGSDDQIPVQYINTYVTHADWGYQIIAWAPKKQRDGLVAAVDELVAGWSFTGDESPQAGPEPGPDSEIEPPNPPDSQADPNAEPSADPNADPSAD